MSSQYTKGHFRDHVERETGQTAFTPLTLLFILSSPPEKGTQSQEGFQHRLPALSTCPQEETPWLGEPRVDHLEEERLDRFLVGALSKLPPHSRFLLPCQLRLVLPPVKKREIFSGCFLDCANGLLPRGGRQATACQKKQSAANASFAPLLQYDDICKHMGATIIDDIFTQILNWAP